MMVSPNKHHSEEHNWIDIQISTFTQWVNRNLQKVDKEIQALDYDFKDGGNLVALVELLQSRKLGRVIQRPINDFQRVENINKALKALREDGVKLVNIGSEDIMSSNLKLILGLIWQLILKYQIGGSRSDNVHPKKRMLLWLQSALPDHKVSNFTSDWNDGKALLALLEYCRPGVTDGTDSGVHDGDAGLEDCRRGLEVAERQLGVPAIISPEALHSPALDELSCMTYLSYFMNKGSPGYTATLDWTNQRLPAARQADDFTDSFRDGSVLCALMTALRCNVPGWPEPLSQSTPTDRINKAVAAAAQLGVDSPFSARDLTAVADADHLLVMAFCTRLRNAVGDEALPVDDEVDASRAGNLQAGRPPGPIEGILIAEPDPTFHTGESEVFCVGEQIWTRLQLDGAVEDERAVRLAVQGPNEVSLPLDEPPRWAPDRLSARVAFTPKATGRHRVQATGDGLVVPALHYQVAPGPAGVSVLLPETWGPEARPCEEQNVSLDIADSEPRALTAEWTEPGGRRNRLEVERDPTTGRHRVRAVPDRPGTWELFVSCDGRPVAGSPFVLDVLDGGPDTPPPDRPLSGHSSSSSASSGRSGGYDLSGDAEVHENGVAAQEVSLWVTEPLTVENGCTINVRGAGQPGVSAVVTKDGFVVPCEIVRPDAQGVQKIQFRPQEAGEYNVAVFNGGAELASSAFSVDRALDVAAVRCVGPGLKAVPVDRETSFDVLCTGLPDAARLAVSITAPGGGRVASELRQAGGTVGVDFTPREVGAHRVEVLLDRQHVPDSPFTVAAFDPRAVDVRLQESPAVGGEAEVEVDLARAGDAPLFCAVRSPSGAELPLSPAESSDAARLRFVYRPQQPGPHLVTVRLGECELNESPFVQHVREKERPPPPAIMPIVYGEGLKRGEVDWPSIFFVDPKGETGELFVQVDGPNSVAKCNIEPEGAGGKYRVTYVPTVVGEYSVVIEWDQTPLADSPFRPLVVAPGAVRCPDLRLGSSRPLEPLYVGRKKELTCHTEDAGPGSLRAEVRGPGGAPVPVRVKERASDRFSAKFTPVLPGVHRMSLLWGDLPLPGSPFEGEALVEQPLDHSKVILSGRGLKEARVNEVSEFVIDGKHAGPGKPTVLMKGVRRDVEVDIEAVLEHRYRCTYTPTLAGAYLLTIWWSERQLRGSPFKITVVAPSDASKVVCSGDGLSFGVIGEEMECQIDTKKAGPGELTAHCSGPQKVAYCELYDHRDGTYTLKIRPQETGRHVLQVKFGGDHVHGSPFMSRVSSAPDPSCVRVYGPGVEHGLLSTFQSRFLVETRGAGAGQLTVRVRGPRGAFRVEMERETRKDRTILCRYDPTEAGEYWISVTWSGRHVPGSPFRVMLLDSREQLRAFARANGLTLDEERSQWQEHL